MSVQSLLAVTPECHTGWEGAVLMGKMEIWQSHYGEIFRMCLKGNASSIYHMRQKPWNHGHMVTVTNTVNMQTFLTHVRDDVCTWRDLIELLHLSRASVNYSPLIVSEVFPRQKCDNLLSTIPVMPHRALKSSTQSWWNGFLWLNHLRKTSVMIYFLHRGEMRCRDVIILTVLLGV